MRFMIIVKSDPATETAMPEASMFEEMGRYNQSLVDAGILLAAEGLAPSKEGAKVRFDGDTQTVKDGPFVEAKELVGGFWIIQVGSLDEAVQWARRIPFRGGEVEVRRVSEASDFEDVVGPEGVAAEEELRTRVEGQSH